MALVELICSLGYLGGHCPPLHTEGVRSILWGGLPFGSIPTGPIDLIGRAEEGSLVVGAVEAGLQAGV